MYDIFASFKTHTFPNGLRLHVLEQPKPFVAVEILIHAGNREDPLGKEGLAHFTEHLVSGNIEDFPDHIKNKKFFRDTGGNCDFGCTGYHFTTYGFCLPNDDRTLLEKGFRMFGNMVLGSKIIRDREKELDIVTQEIWRKHANPDLLRFRLKPLQSLFGDHRVSRSDGLGLPQTISGLSYEDVQSFYDRYYCPSNMQVICTGGLSLEQVIDLLEGTRFANSPGGKLNPNHLSITPTSVQKPEEKVIVVSGKELGIETEQLKYKAGWVITPPHSHQVAETVSTVLSELLFEEVRENQQLAYSIGTKLWTYQDFFLLIVSGGMRMEAKDRIDETVRSIIRSLRNNKERIMGQIERELKSLRFIDPTTRLVLEMASDDLSRFNKIVTITEEKKMLESLTWMDMLALIEELESERTISTIITN